MTTPMTLEHWEAHRAAVAVDPAREERLRRVAQRAGIIPRTSSPPSPQIATQQAGERITEDSWDVSKPCRGLGDVVAKITHATGIDTLVKAVKPKGCGCKKRQERLNAAVPFAGNQ